MCSTGVSWPGLVVGGAGNLTSQLAVVGGVGAGLWSCMAKTRLDQATSRPARLTIHGLEEMIRLFARLAVCSSR